MPALHGAGSVFADCSRPGSDGEFLHSAEEGRALAPGRSTPPRAYGMTSNAALLESVPLGIVTSILPPLAPLGTGAVMKLFAPNSNVAGTPLNVTLVVPAGSVRHHPRPPIRAAMMKDRGYPRSLICCPPCAGFSPSSAGSANFLNSGYF